MKSISTLFCYSCFLFLAGNDAGMASWPLKIASGVWSLCVLILVAAYTANLAAFLTTSRMSDQFQNFEEVLNIPGLKIGTVNNSSVYDFIKVNIISSKGIINPSSINRNFINAANHMTLFRRNKPIKSG